MSDAEIIPIEHHPENTSVTALLTVKSRYPMSRLARMTEDELQALKRQYYQQALEENVVTMINLVTRQAGALEAAGGRYVWRQVVDDQRALESIYVLDQGTSEVRVNNQLVFSNQTPGYELIVPGRWLYAFAATFRRLEAEKAWRDQLQGETSRETLMLNLGADV